MDLWTATWAEVTLAGLCLLTLAIALATARRQRTSRVAISETDTKTIAKHRLLELRVSDLATAVAELERWRDSTVGTDVLDLRSALTGGRKTAETSVVRVPSAET